MKLIIVESPAKSKTISKILGNEYKVIASMGHVRDLPKSSIGIDIENNFSPKYQVSKEKKDIVKNIKENITKADYVYIATDEDREGEAIGWHIVELSQLKTEDFKRITFHEITPLAIKNAVLNPRDLDLNLIDAQKARRILDRLVGYMISPIIGKMMYKGLSAGRVQSATLKLVVDREREIEKFIKEEYWTIDADCLTSGEKIQFKANLSENNGYVYKDHDIKTKLDADKILEEVDRDNFYVEDISSKKLEKSPKPPFITSTLQQVASRALGFSSSKTMTIAQKLYEGISLDGEILGLITYMRTDSLNISKLAIDDAKDFILKTFGKEFLPKKQNIYKTKDKTAQEAHECIRPTYVDKTPEFVKKYLTKDENKLYELIWSRFLASQMSNAIFDKSIIKLKSNKTIWTSIGEIKKFDGYLSVYKIDDINKDIILPNVKIGDKIDIIDINTKQHFTEPPSRYIESSLIKTMEKNGIGRPSTYATTISNILNRNYIKLEEKKIFPEKLGIEVIDFLEKFFPKIVDIKFTAEMEESLDDIADGKKNWIDILNTFYLPFSLDIKKAKDFLPEKKLKKFGEVCPNCGSDLVYRRSRFGEFVGCSAYPKCKYIHKNENTTDEKEHEILGQCPKCGKDLVKKRSKYGEFIACSGYPDCKYSKNLEGKELGKCPDCGKDLVVKIGRRGKFIACTGYPDCKHIEKYKK